MEQNRLQFIDFMRGIAILNVVFIHLGQAVLDNFAMSICHRICIPVFIFVTGYTVGFSQSKPYISNLIKKVSYMVNMIFIYLLITYLYVDHVIPLHDIFSHILNGTVPEIKNIAMWYLPFYISLYFIIWTEIKLVKFIYDLIFYKLGKYNKFFYYILLIIISVVIASEGCKLDITNESIFANNPFFIKQAMITQVFAIYGYFVFCIEKYTITIKEKLNTIQLEKYKFIVLVAWIVILVIALVLFIVLAKKYGVIDIRPMLWAGPISSFISVISALTFVFVMSKMICKTIGDFVLVRFVSYCGKRSIHICALHLLVLMFLDKYLKLLPGLMELVNDNSISKLFINTIVLTIISIFTSYAIEREK